MGGSPAARVAGGKRHAGAHAGPRCRAHVCTRGTTSQRPEPRAFTWTGEIHELKEELRSLDRPKKKDAVKKVIAAMTVGKDVSMLFPDVVNCMQTEDLELKKLVYLYLINYAKTQPDLAIMAVNTFVKVCGRAWRVAPGSLRTRREPEVPTTNDAGLMRLCMCALPL